MQREIKERETQMNESHEVSWCSNQPHLAQCTHALKVDNRHEQF